MSYLKMTADVKLHTSHVEVSDFPSGDFVHDVQVLAVVVYYQITSSYLLRYSSHRYLVTYSEMRQLSTASAISTRVSIYGQLRSHALMQILLGVDIILDLILQLVFVYGFQLHCLQALCDPRTKCCPGFPNEHRLE